MQYLLWLSLKVVGFGVFFFTIAEETGSRPQAPWRPNCKENGQEEQRWVFPTMETLPRSLRFPAVLSTYNTPTIITWIGPWRYVILCMNLYFSSLCMMMGRMTEQRRRGEKKEVRRGTGAFKELNVMLRRTHSWRGHGDPGDDHLRNAFHRRSLPQRQRQS